MPSYIICGRFAFASSLPLFTLCKPSIFFHFTQVFLTFISHFTFETISFFDFFGILHRLVSFHTMHFPSTIQMAVRTFIRKVWMILAKYLLCLGRIAFKSSLWLGHFRCSPGRCLLQNGSSMGRVRLFLKTRREPCEG